MTPELDHPIRTVRDLAQVWEFIDGGHGYDAPQMFAVVIDADDRLIPTVVQIYDEEFEDGPDEEAMRQFLAVHDAALAGGVSGASVAVMRARPGGSAFTAQDRAWCAMTHRLMGEMRCGTRPLFFATDRTVGVVPPDVLVGATG
ncbi:hypothetical protein [Aeromicrobium sp.]|uniref:hypothetical protein n=1 Tax=Aeromicrobium sp. TaxID=1871063 RepID=UPI0025B7B66D|nr:hypothetical protein [Aeromicrobium sp.]MCK5891837.1 hypothetical protein [Aeromicrobium sp.]